MCKLVSFDYQVKHLEQIFRLSLTSNNPNSELHQITSETSGSSCQNFHNEICSLWQAMTA